MSEEVYVLRVGGNKAYTTKSYRKAVELFLGASEEGEDIQVIRATPADIIKSVPEGKIEESVLWKYAYKHGWGADWDLLKEVKNMEEIEEIEMDLEETPEEEFEEASEEEGSEESEEGFESAEGFGEGLEEEEEMGLGEGLGEEEEGSEEGEIDYQKLADQNVLDIKERSKTVDLDYQKLLEIERKRKDRESLKKWLRDQIGESEKEAEEKEMEEMASLPEGRLPNKKGIQSGLWLYAEPADVELEELESYPTQRSEMISMADTNGEITEGDVEDFRERKANQIEQAREEEMIPVIVKSFDDSIALERA